MLAAPASRPVTRGMAYVHPADDEDDHDHHHDDDSMVLSSEEESCPGPAPCRALGLSLEPGMSAIRQLEQSCPVTRFTIAQCLRVTELQNEVCKLQLEAQIIRLRAELEMEAVGQLRKCPWVNEIDASLASTTHPNQANGSHDRAIGLCPLRAAVFDARAALAEIQERVSGQAEGCDMWEVGHSGVAATASCNVHAPCT